MVLTNRHRLVYGIITAIMLLTGLASRRFFGDIPFVRNYVGDGLWALMLFFGIALLFPRWSVWIVALSATLFSLAIELSQLYHAPWIDAIRSNQIGGLLLGFSFMWSDLLCYGLGITVGILIDDQLIPAQFRLESQSGKHELSTF